MFERRLKAFLAIFIGIGLIVGARLVHLQVVKAHDYLEDANDVLSKPPRYIPAVRGRILDRYSRVLACDEPSWDLCMDYRALSKNESYIRWKGRQWRKRGLLPEVPNLSEEDRRRHDQDLIAKKIEEGYLLAAELTGVSLTELFEQRDYILKRVQAVERALLQHYGYFVPPREARMMHPLVRSLDDQTAVQARLAVADLDWMTVRPSTQRVYYDAVPLAHVLGRTGQVTAEACENDPFTDDELRRYLPGETFGVAGVERLCEGMLRGRRGKVETTRDNVEIEHIDPRDGLDVALTIDAELQARVYELVEEAVKDHKPCTGGAAVVLHVPTREVFALVSYPAFNPNTYRDDFQKLIDDTLHRPTLFRAVAGVYAPGSVAKAPTLAIGLTLGLITPETRLDCHGYLHNPHGHFKCWIYNKYGTSHNQAGFPHGLCAEEALQVSCNCYFYQLGERIKGDRLCQWFRQFWVGPPAPPGTVAGTGLIEERDGILPTAAWLWEHQRRPMRVGDSRNFAIGQGEVGMTPLQVANLMATIASGTFRWPTVVANDMRERPTWDLGIKPSHWQAVRNGLYRVVNRKRTATSPGGTAYKYAHMDEITVAGKTGSAQCSRIVLDKRYVVEYPDGRREKIIAKNRARVEEQIADHPGAKVIGSRANRLWPPKGQSSTHAWFACYVPGGPGQTPEFAIAVLVEFGESGGRAAAPVAKKIIHALMDSPQGYLSPSQAPPPM